MEGFCKQKLGRARSLLAKEKKLFQARSSFCRGKAGSLIILITSLLLMRKFQADWFKVHSWERLKLQQVRQ